MRKYIEDLTNELIRKGFYVDIWKEIQENDFLFFVWADLKTGAVLRMNPETLGKIVCSFDRGDVWVNQDEISRFAGFNGSGEEMLRNKVALFLASLIRDRINPASASKVLPYRGVERFQLQRN